MTNDLRQNLTKENELYTSSYSGYPVGGRTIEMISLISLYLRMRSLTVVDVRDGDAFTSISHGFRASSMIISYP
jgi:hypothetical protein